MDGGRGEGEREKYSEELPLDAAPAHSLLSLWPGAMDIEAAASSISRLYKSEDDCCPACAQQTQQ
jgi:hypothetical protein